MKQNQLTKIKPTERSVLTSKLFKLFLYMGKKETIVEQARVVLAHIDDFEPRQLFERIAFDHQQMTADKLHLFMQLYPPQEG